MLVVSLLGIGIGFYRARNKAEFRMKGFPTSLSKDVVAEVTGYERREADGEKVTYYIKADRATTFADQHQELQNVYFQVFGDSGAFDEITADKAVYVPGENKDFTAYLAGSVEIKTRDALVVQTEQVTYRRANETATADEQVKFSRGVVTGASFGAVVNVPGKKVELLKDVTIQTVGADGGKSELSSGYASYDQENERIDLRDGLKGTTRSADTENDVEANRAIAFLASSAENERDIAKVELFDNVKIDSRRGGDKPTNISAGYALYEKPEGRFTLRNAVHVISAGTKDAAEVHGDSAVYEQFKNWVGVSGQARLSQGAQSVTGDRIEAELYPTKQVKAAFVKGKAALSQREADRTIDVSAERLDASFGGDQKLTAANAVGNAKAILTPSNAVEYSRVALEAPSAVRISFNGGILAKMQTDGRTTIQMTAPAGKPDAANKRITADVVRTFFDGEGKNITKAEAEGNAELYVEPLTASVQNYKTTVRAPRFDCEFFPSGNSARTCVAAAETKTVRVPTVPSADRGEQTLTADRLTADFSESTRDVDILTAQGAARFSERDTNASSEEIRYGSGDGVVRLRGGEPTVWDSRARAKAGEIDWDTRGQRTYLKGGISTTYYSQKQTGGAAPFGQSDKPVYITADSAEIDHRTESAVYRGNARGWQENNYVRAATLYIDRPKGLFKADGSVQSLLYDAKRKDAGKETIVPVFATASHMIYERDGRVLRYNENVDIRQGTDRITAGEAVVILDGKGEVVRTVAEKDVNISQPNRRASGNFAQFVAADQSVILRGDPARVRDNENGSTEGGQLTFFMNENRVIGEGKTDKNPSGRIRSVYKVKEQ